MRKTIRRKLIIAILLPVIGIYAVLLLFGVEHVRAWAVTDEQRWLAEYTKHQSSRLALLFSQVPALAESLGDILLADPEQAQSLLYAHLIDGLRRTPIAQAAAIRYHDPYRGAVMRRGAPMARPLVEEKGGQVASSAGWQVVGPHLRFNRPIYRKGNAVGDSWAQLAIADIYAELDKRQDAGVTLYVQNAQGQLLEPLGAPARVQRLAQHLPLIDKTGEFSTFEDQDGTAYWTIANRMPMLPLMVSAVMPVDAALAPVRQETLIVVLGLLTALVAIVLAIGLATRQITRPLETLDQSVRRIADGDFSVSPAFQGDDELGRLAATIRRMANLIGKREQQLLDAQQVLEQRVDERTSELQHSNQRLSRQVEETREAHDALQVANRKAQQASRAKTEFLSNMSHELRTPLHGVLGYTQILRREAQANPAQRDSLDAIERCGQHLLTLINNILDLTKIEAGQMHLDLRPVNIDRLIADVHDMVAERAKAKGIALNTEIPGDLPMTIITDPVKLRQILLNLLDNAVKFTERGHIDLKVDAPGRQRLRFEVCDTGLGIPDGLREQIFEAFQQTSEGRTVEGTGLGLSINERLINLLDGEPLEVESRVGGGSCFRFCVPLRIATGVGDLAPADLQPPMPPKVLQGETYNILVVDEVEENRNMLCAMLDQTRCRVEHAPSLDDALRILHDRRFDLVLIDVRLPDDSAKGAASEVRLSAAGEPKLVAVSTSVFSGVSRYARHAGFDDFLAKPFSDQQLYDLFNRLLERQETAHPNVAETGQHWPQPLARETVQHIRTAISHGDVDSLVQLNRELADNPAAPAAEVAAMASLIRHFDLDGLRRLADKIDRPVDD